MFQTKYNNEYKGVREALEASKDTPYTEADFDLSCLRSSRLFEILFAIFGWLLRRIIFPLSQRFRPVWSIGGISVVTRLEDVQTVLNAPETFEVPFGLEMEDMTGGPVFALGDDGAEHARQIAAARAVWDKDRIIKVAQDVIADVTPALLEDSGGDINVATDVLMRVMSEACTKAFGLTVPNADRFAAYATACSIRLFADPFGSDATRKQAIIGARRMREVLNANIESYINTVENGGLPVTHRGFMHDLVDELGPANEGTRDTVRAIIFGFITGFLPTVSLSAGKMLTHLRANPMLMSNAKRLAQNAAQDPDAFQQFLFEVGRHNPALFPGQMRRRKASDTYFHAQLNKIPVGNLVFVCTGAAMHDVTAMKYPNRFNPEDGFTTKAGDTAPDLSFGAGLHVCFGTDEARQIIPTLLGLLLRQPGIAFSKKRIVSFGPYLGEMRMTFDVAEGHREQAMMNAIIPLRKGANGKALAAELRAALDKSSPIRRVFADSGIVHFSSLTAINLGSDPDLEADPTHLLVELNVDGSEDSALRALTAKEGDAFAAVLTYLEGSSSSFFARTRARLLRPKTRPWGTIGVNFPGTWDSSVKQIQDERNLYASAKNELQRLRDDASREIGKHEDATDLINQIRATLSETPAFRRMMFRPADRFPAFSRHEETSLNTFLFRYILPRRRQILIGIYIAVTLLLPLLLALCAGFFVASYTYIALWAIPAFLGLTLLIIAIALLRRAETSEKPDERFAPHDYVDRIKAGEDLPDHVQNHITSVSALKPGFFRKITTALAFNLIGQMVVLWFRPGFVTDFATIHYARWVRPRGIDKMIFQSNYDGSWESYLEDFITKVHPGQTMAWNNCVGFPKTRWFALEGAEDGDAFKRWVRRQQVPLQFWYSHFPDMTTGVIRTNALVRDGLARAETFDEHKAWLALFESKPRPEHALDTSQIQTLLFRGLGRHKFMHAHMLTFTHQQRAKLWLAEIVEGAHIAHAPALPAPGAISFGDAYPDGSPSFVAFTAKGIDYLGFPDAPFDGRPTLPHAFVDGMAGRPQVLGDPVSARATGQPDWRWSDNETHAVLLIYARTKRELNATNDILLGQLKDFGIEPREGASVFADMEREEGRVFGFRDGISQPVMRGTQVHAKGNASEDDVVEPGEFILGYPDTRGFVQPPVTVSRNRTAATALPSVGGAVDGLVPSFGTEKNNLSDFGRNGSFLVIRQFLHDDTAFDDFVTAKARRVEAEDPGYQNLKQSLPRTEDNLDVATSDDARFLHRKAWMGAKLFGRWADGSSLTRNPSMSATTRNRTRFFRQVQQTLESTTGRNEAKVDGFLDRMGKIGEPPKAGEDLHITASIWTDPQWERFLAEFEDLQRDLVRTIEVDRTLLNPIVPDNDFRHGTDDPQGLNCPIGAHIRRSNPRDSFRPGDEITLEINNRHRLLRRGRTFYGKDPDENGSFFMCFNSNLERQFEFVQQTWIDSRFFHGGREGPDPIVTAKEPGDKHVIPGASKGTFLDMHTGTKHKDFVEVVGGGYFFMPSRQALEYLARLPDRKRDPET